MSLQTLTNEVLISWGIPDALVSLGTGTITPADAKKFTALTGSSLWRKPPHST